MAAKSVSVAYLLAAVVTQCGHSLSPPSFCPFLAYRHYVSRIGPISLEFGHIEENYIRL